MADNNWELSTGYSSFEFPSFPSTESNKSGHESNDRSPHSSNETDLPHLRGLKALPSCTSKWTTVCLDSLGIFYDDNFLSSPSDILDIIFRKRGIFSPLNEDQHTYEEKVKRCINFSSSMQEIIATQHEDEDILLSDKLLPEMKKDIESIRKEMANSTVENIHTVAEDFIFNAGHMIMCEVAYLKDMEYRDSQGPASRDIFVEIVRMFGRMCRLAVIPGSTWEGKMNIRKNSVTSLADLVMMPLDFNDEPLGKQRPHLSAVVSVVEVKNLLSVEARSDIIGSVPAIYQKVRSKVLGQHGGELLLYSRMYEEKLTDNRKRWRYFPGMLVIGTEVIFTLLEINNPHLIELKKDNSVPISQIAKIYYSEPKDLLKKEDRDILLESFIRLNNVD